MSWRMTKHCLNASDNFFIFQQPAIASGGKHLIENRNHDNNCYSPTANSEDMKTNLGKGHSHEEFRIARHRTVFIKGQ